jgi:protein-disulfide isomerase
VENTEIMATRDTAENQSLIPWRKRAAFRLGKTRRQRQEQHRQQINVLALTLLVTVVAAGLVVYFNYREAGSTKEVSCAEFPEYCVPFAGNLSTNPVLDDNESEGARALDAEPQATPGVVRGYNQNGIPFLGDPSAPVHFITVSDYACSHCQDFHLGDLKRFMDNHVMTGDATFGFAMTTGTGQVYSQTASQAALCAGEQGAFWEMSSELFRLATSAGIQSAFSLSQIKDSADDMGLDSQELVDCVSSAKYLSLLASHTTFAQDNGVTGTPTVLISYDGVNWSRAPSRAYDTLVALTQAANRNAQ